MPGHVNLAPAKHWQFMPNWKDGLLTLVGVVSSDVSRSSCTTSFTPCCSIFSQSYVFFQGCPRLSTSWCYRCIASCGVVKTGISHIVKRLKLVCVFAIGAVPIHDVATRDKRLLGSELAFMHYYLNLDRVPKYSTKQSLPLYNPFR